MRRQPYFLFLHDTIFSSSSPRATPRSTSPTPTLTIPRGLASQAPRVAFPLHRTKQSARHIVLKVVRNPSPCTPPLHFSPRMAPATATVRLKRLLTRLSSTIRRFIRNMAHQRHTLFKVMNQEFWVDSKFRITRELGQGAYGLVWYLPPPFTESFLAVRFVG